MEAGVKYPMENTIKIWPPKTVKKLKLYISKESYGKEKKSSHY